MKVKEVGLLEESWEGLLFLWWRKINAMNLRQVMETWQQFVLGKVILS
jgi:hypothetical protein